MNAATIVLDRLEGVKATGPRRWLARCPAHKDRSPSLSIREMEDGRVLLYDFGCCSTADVLTAMGLELADLFEKPLGQSFSPSHSRIPARDILEAIDSEILVAVMVLDEILATRRVRRDQVERLTQAAAAIGLAREQARGR